MEIIKTFNGEESDLKTGTISVIYWDGFMPFIKQTVRLREDEIIDGLVISEEKVSVKISRKKGRKTK